MVTTTGHANGHRPGALVMADTSRLSATDATAAAPVLPVTVRELAGLAWSLRRLSGAIEDVLSVLAVAVADSPPDTVADSPPDTGPDIGPDDTGTVLASLWPPGAVSLMRDVATRDSVRRGARYRGRVRWIEPGTGRYRGHSRTFATSADAWAWVRTWTAPGSR